MQNIFNQNMVSAFNEGDKRFVARWYKAYYPDIECRVRQMTDESTEALDLASDVVTIMLERKGAFETIRNIESYLDDVIKTICERYMDRKKTKRTNSRKISEHLKNLAEETREKAIIRDKFRYLNYLATEKLPHQCKIVFNLSYHEEMSYKEIAQLLNISVKAVEYRKSEAFK